MIKKILIFGTVLILVSFLALNIYFSQNNDPLLFGLLRESNEKQAINFLTKIKKKEDFRQNLQYFQEIYGREIEVEVFKNDRKRAQEIARLETALKKNPQSRDLLVNLAVLYYLDDNRPKAKDYYSKARAIDPEIKIEELEKIN